MSQSSRLRPSRGGQQGHSSPSRLPQPARHGPSAAHRLPQNKEGRPLLADWDRVAGRSTAGASETHIWISALSLHFPASNSGLLSPCEMRLFHGSVAGPSPVFVCRSSAFAIVRDARPLCLVCHLQIHSWLLPSDAPTGSVLSKHPPKTTALPCPFGTARRPPVPQPAPRLHMPDWGGGRC